MTGNTPALPRPALREPANAAGDSFSLLQLVRRIWRITGHVELPAGQSPSAAIDRLEPLFVATGTSYERTEDAIIFSKKDPAAQDRLAVFDAGILHVSKNNSVPILRYELTSRILLACFLAPLLFLAFAQITLAIGAWDKAAAEAETKAEKAKKGTKEKPEPKELALNPIDVALGAPPPKTKKERAREKAEREKEPPSATPAFVFAGLFAALYLIGRLLEARLVKSRFRKALQSA